MSTKLYYHDVVSTFGLAQMCCTDSAVQEKIRIVKLRDQNRKKKKTGKLTVNIRCRLVGGAAVMAVATLCA